MNKFEHVWGEGWWSDLCKKGGQGRGAVKKEGQGWGPNRGVPVPGTLYKQTDTTENITFLHFRCRCLIFNALEKRNTVEVCLYDENKYLLAKLRYNTQKIHKKTILFLNSYRLRKY